MIKELKVIDIVLSIYNQEKLIEKVLYGIFKNTTTPFNLIVIFDGCTDRTEKRALKYIKRYKTRLLRKLIVEHANNVFETRANNIGFKKANEDFMITLQDDMVINELGWERRLTYPLRKFDDVIAVTGRIAQDLRKINDFNDQEIFTNQSGRELNNLPRNIFAIRDTINRGPVAFNMNHLRSMNYLNERYAPSDLDDADLCLRAWKEKKLRCGSYWIDYISRLEWGKARAKDSTMVTVASIRKNISKIREDHRDYIESNNKHSEDVVINENEIDYLSNSKINYLYNILTYPIRLNRNEIKKMFKNVIKNILQRTLNTKSKNYIKKNGIRKTIILLFNPNKFTSVRIMNKFLLGTYDRSYSSTWKRMIKGDFELTETNIVEKLIPYFDNFIDIGGHIGYFSCLVGSNNKNANILVFEPNPINYKTLKKNIDINNIKKNTKIFNIGLSDKSGETLLFGEDAGGTINTKSIGKNLSTKIKIKIEKLDSFINEINYNKPSFIKIDTEASEYQIIKGGENLINKIKPIGIIMEIVKHWSGGDNTNFNDTFNLLHKLNYTSYIVDDNFPLKSTSDTNNLIGGNYLFIRNDLINKIKTETKII